LAPSSMIGTPFHFSIFLGIYLCSASNARNCAAVMSSGPL
jgi:hypothetical protein